MKEFKEFLLRGNVVDLAVAVVIGGAFTAIVTALSKGILTPLVGMIVGTDFSDMTFTLNGSTFSYGIVIDAVISFVLISAVVFFLIVKPMQVLAARRAKGEVEADEPTPEAVLLTEIRDLLRARQ
ncbi:MAG: large conductance mechanosensitive channel protein MscL [Microthrixaceae bacterium]|nr:large conductance mechanosensitive channel protein MscL [Microthrixaceae bacterium]